MRRNALTFGLIGLVLVLLVGLNLVFIAEPRRDETEQNGDRSSYKGTPYGTLAYYLLLEERGHTVVRFEQPYTALAESEVSTLMVVVPHGEHQPTPAEIAALDQWVTEGGKLVVFDRYIDLELAEFTIEANTPLDGAVRPATPSMYTRGVERVGVTPLATTVTETSDTATIHFTSDTGPLVIDRPYGEGRVVVVSEPYVVQNNGIAEADNLTLALNLVESIGEPGTIAFDEYHHGYGATTGGSSGGIRGYIVGTPVPWILLQVALLALVVALTVGRRFGRAIPVASERRTSALEFVSSMASIQMLARASDLAVENIYTSFRSRLCRYAGLPSDTTSAELARVAAARGAVEERELREVLRRCEEALSGAPPKPDELLALVSRLRAIEQKLKL